MKNKDSLFPINKARNSNNIYILYIQTNRIFLKMKLMLAYANIWTHAR